MARKQPDSPRARMADVARLAGVSTATVSRSLRGSLVADKTRERVLQAARDLEYELSPAASQLATGRTQTIAVVVPFASRWFFSEVIAGAEDVLRGAGLQLLLYNIGHVDARGYFFDRLPLRRRVDAALIVSSALTSRESDAMTSLGIPLCVLGSAIPGHPSVLIDDELAAATATRHLLALRHERISMICGDPHDPIGHATTRRRREGFEATLARAGVRPLSIASAPWGLEGGARAMEILLGQPNLPTAIFAESDEMALGALRTARGAGLRTPEDISIIGIDDHELASAVELTTVAQPAWRQGAAAAATITRLLRGDELDPISSTVLPTKLMIRRTTSPPAEVHAGDYSTRQSSS